MKTFQAIVATGDKIEQGLMQDWGSMLVEAETPEAAAARVKEIMTGVDHSLVRMFEAHPDAD